MHTINSSYILIDKKYKIIIIKFSFSARRLKGMTNETGLKEYYSYMLPYVYSLTIYKRVKRQFSVRIFRYFEF